jgi:cob(I)alamin adenosyltransferase
VDELNAHIGAARALAEEITDRNGRVWPLVPLLLRVQHELFNLGSILSTLPEDVHPNQARVTDAEVAQLELEMDHMNADLPALRSFVLPGSGRLNAALHICRTVCRRAERVTVSLARLESVPPEAIRYLNRLSDALFVWGRWASHSESQKETLWSPNSAASGQGRG